MRILKYITFSFVILNFASIGLSIYGGSVGGVLSYLTLFFLLVYYFFQKKTTPNFWLIIISLFFYLIAGIKYTGENIDLLYTVIKYFVLLICGYELIKNISTTTYFYFLFIGALSIPFEAFFHPSAFGRYSGFYLNPNVAGFICITGYAITFGLQNAVLKIIGQFVFTLSGLLTFSRTFIVIWLLINLLSLKISIKNIRILGIGFLIISTLFFFDEIVGLNNPRFDQLKRFINKEEVSAQEVNQDSRFDTWAKFYDKIIESPLIGNGYGTFSGNKAGDVGVHNTYLRILGEAGIIPFLFFLLYIFFLLYKSTLYFKKNPNLIMQTIALTLFLLANHNFFDFYFVTMAAMWIQYAIYKNEREKIELSTKQEIHQTKC